MSEAADTRLALNDFFVNTQHRALRQTEIAIGDKDEAMDIVQHAMMKLAGKYSQQRNQWPQLFQRILQNAIRDWYRRQKIKRLMFWQHGDSVPEPDILNEPLDTTPSDSHSEQYSPEQLMLNTQKLMKIENALKQLPTRQQQVFLLRAWWGNNTQETAFAMQCSTGSVKTHYSRALQKLQSLLEDVR